MNTKNELRLSAPPREKTGVVDVSRGEAEMRRVKFGDIAFNSVAKKKPTAEDAARYIGLEHIDPGSFVVSRWGGDVAPIGEKLLMKKGDLLFGKRRAYQRKVAIAPFDGIFSAHGMVLRPKTDVVDERYFPFFIASDQFMDMAVKISVGGLSPTINWKTLKECEFNLPPLARQRELANLLWAANDLKESYKKAITATDEMLKAKFREMFGETGDTSRGAAESRSEGCRVKSFAGEEQNVKMVKLKEITQGFRNGLSPSRRGDIHAKVLTLTAITQGTFDASQWKDATFDDVPAIDKYISESDFYICRGNGNKSLVGVGVAAPSDYEDLVFPDTMIAVKVDRQLIDLKFLAFAWKSISIRKQIESIAKTTNGIYKINQEGLGGVVIPLPPLSLQREFVAIAERADAAKSALKQSIADIDQVMKGLINQ